MAHILRLQPWAWTSKLISSGPGSGGPVAGEYIELSDQIEEVYCKPEAPHALLSEDEMVLGDYFDYQYLRINRVGEVLPCLRLSTA